MPPPVSRDFGFVVGLAERALEAAVAFRVRESQRAQLQRLREARAEMLAGKRRQRVMEAEARERRKRLRLRLKEEKDLSMEEIMRRASQMTP
mmetsp:Transcript_83480/g.244750  ORF Transcript_83480/g.244750 Transcript_83480/m.244750 type:complete len:92 (+) Transcript_83480:653-928(+)